MPTVVAVRREASRSFGELKFWDCGFYAFRGSDSCVFLCLCRTILVRPKESYQLQIRFIIFLNSLLAIRITQVL
jgi:hypothetical protein